MKSIAFTAAKVTILVSFQLVIQACSGHVESKLDRSQIKNIPEITPTTPVTIEPSKSYQPIKPNGRNVTKFSSPKIELQNNEIKLSVTTTINNSKTKSLTLSGTVSEFGEAFLTNDNEPNIKATFLCIDTENCTRSIVDFYILPNTVRIQQYIVDVKPPAQDSNISEEPVEEPEEVIDYTDSYYSDDVTYPVNYDPYIIHDGDNVASEEYVGIKPPDTFFKPRSKKYRDMINGKTDNGTSDQEEPKDGSATPPATNETPEPQKEEPASPEPPQNSTQNNNPSDADSQLMTYNFNPTGGVARGFYTKGTLKDSTRIPKSGPGFVKINRSSGKNYGSGYLVDFLKKTTSDYLNEFPKTQFMINGLSKKRGGKAGRHKSHQNGLDVDISFLPGHKWKFTSTIVKSSNNKKVWSGPIRCSNKYKMHKDFNIEENFNYFKNIVELGVVNRIFVNCNIKKAMCKWAKDKGNNFFKQQQEVFRRLRVDNYHHDHFHLRLKCHSSYSRCRSQAEPPQGHGCP